jgi:UDP-glucose 4-epimerase
VTRILVTGAAGFLGFYIARQLAETPENSIVCVDSFVRGRRDSIYRDLTSRPNVSHVTADLCDPAAVANLPDDIDVVFHMAALNGTQNFYERPFEVVRSCTLPTMHLLEKYGPMRRLKRWLYAGTSEAYASTVTRFGWEVPTGEEVPLGIDDIANARWSYGASKMHGEIATINGCRHFGIPYTIARFHNAYGPRMGDKHVIPDFLARARNGVYELYGHEDTRSFIYAEDAARATILLANADAAAGQVVNVGSEDEMTIRDLGQAIMQAAGLAGEIVLHPSPKGSVRRRAPKIGRLRQLTGYSPEWTLAEGLKTTAGYYLSEAAVEYERSASTE